MTHKAICALWYSLPEAMHWAPVEWVRVCIDRPEVATVGSHTTGEVFAVLDLREQRVLNEEQFASRFFETLNWREVFAGGAA